MSAFAAVILAAGRGRRFGGGKLLEDFAGLPLAAHAVAAAQAAGLSPIVAVCARNDAALQSALSSADVKLALVENDALSDSLRVGLDAVTGAPGAFILLADMPLVDAPLIKRLAGAWDGQALAVAPVHEGQRGNPILLSARGFALAKEVVGDRGLGAMLSARANEVLLVAAPRSCLVDVDTRADLVSARALLDEG